MITKTTVGLTDKEMKACKAGVPMCDSPAECCDCSGDCGSIAKAQLKKFAEWVIELNDTDEEEDNSPGAYYVISKNLLQAVLEEVKE